MSTKFSMAGSKPSRSLSVFYTDGDNATIPESHPRFQELLDLLLEGADNKQVKDLVDIMLAVAKRLSVLSERVTYVNNKILFDGDEISGVLVDALREAYEADKIETLRPIVNFLEKVKTNPAISSIDGLWRWVNAGELTITQDGNFYAYKGLTSDGKSVHSGTAFVDGVEVTGQIPNVPGTTVSMPRSTVDDGGHNYCSTGLHAGKWDFAFGFALGNSGSKNVVLIEVNPRDVVSVPTDSSSAKLRVCRYKVVKRVKSKLDFYIDLSHTPEPATAEIYKETSKNVVEDVKESEEETLLPTVTGGVDTEIPVQIVEDVTETADAFVKPFEEPTKLDDALVTELTEAMAKPVADPTPLPVAGFVIKAPAAEEKEPVKADGRDAKGRFTKASVAVGLRDEKGRFIGKKK